jgi:hypothetical protein
MNTNTNDGLGWDEDAIKLEAARAAERVANRTSLYRFFLKRGTEGSVTFVSPKPLLPIKEHKFPWGGNLYNLELSPRGFLKEGEVDILTEKFGEPYSVWMFLLIDHTAYAKRDGTIVKNQLKLLPVKHKDINFFLRMSVDPEFGAGSMRGLRCLVVRSAEQLSASIGDKWIPKERKTGDEDLYKLYPEAMKLADTLLADGAAKFKAMFKPKTYAELKEKYDSDGTERPINKDVNNSGPEQDTDIPF